MFENIGPFWTMNLLILRTIDQRADQVGRQQIGRELQALKAGAESLGETSDRGRFRQTGTPSISKWPLASRPTSMR